MYRNLLVVAVALSACTRAQAPHTVGVMQQGASSALRGRFANHVLVVSIDGLRPDAIAKYNAKTLHRLMAEGRYSLTAQTISLSNTLPSHTSMLTGVDLDQHGITWNSDRTAELGHVHVPTMFGVARSAGFTTAAFFSKTKFNTLEAPGTLDYVRGPEGGVIPWNAGKTIDEVRSYLRDASPNLLFVHIADADFVGHSFGWMGHLYGMAVREADLAVERLLDLADESFGAGRYTVIVTADHGGHGKRHGSTDPLDTTIPWIVWGAGVEPGDTLSGIHTMDTAVTALWMLGLTPPDDVTGHAVTAAFSQHQTADRTAR